jgi:hypothetical protein
MKKRFAGESACTTWTNTIVCQCGAGDFACQLHGEDRRLQQSTMGLRPTNGDED